MPERRNSLSRAAAREVDRRAIDEYGLPGLVLMENAGRGAAELLLRQGVTGPVCICCGKGNNGGDGFVIARHLDLAGIDVRILLAGAPEEFAGDAAINYRIVERSGLPIARWGASTNKTASEWLHTSAWNVDALLGTGMQGTIREPYASLIEAINASGRPVLAVDLPSGLDCDTGVPLGPCVRAKLTATFVARKHGFDNPASVPYTGDIHVISIGAPRRLMEELATM
jgi:NAD(P)H-hydrate epimerase